MTNDLFQDLDQSFERNNSYLIKLMLEDEYSDNLDVAKYQIIRIIWEDYLDDICRIHYIKKTNVVLNPINRYFSYKELKKSNNIDLHNHVISVYLNTPDQIKTTLNICRAIRI